MTDVRPRRPNEHLRALSAPLGRQHHRSAGFPAGARLPLKPLRLTFPTALLLQAPGTFRAGFTSDGGRSSRACSSRASGSHPRRVNVGLRFSALPLPKCQRGVCLLEGARWLQTVLVAETGFTAGSSVLSAVGRPLQGVATTGSAGSGICDRFQVMFPENISSGSPTLVLRWVSSLSQGYL